VELTEDGQLLQNTLAGSFSNISRVLETIRDRSAAEKVSVGSTAAVAALWLSPAIIRFWREFPDINVSQVAQDQPFVGRADLDFFVRYGKDPDPTLSHTPLYQDHLMPVASPELAEQLSGASLEELAGQRLMHLETSRSWTSWQDWFRALGYTGTIPVESRVNSYSIALQMARKGAGLALGWQRLIQPMLETGKLVPIGPHSLQAPNKFYLVGRPDEELSDAAL
jgi:DNA-binding transcriptional LysR family regulator